MKFSAWLDICNPWPELVEEAAFCETTGWDGIWLSDHFMPNLGDIGGPWQECWTSLAALGALVPRLRVGSLVVGNTLRNPAVLAKQVAQVDVITGGRCVLGIGAGYFQPEHEAYGIRLGSMGERHRKLVESLEIIRSLFENDRTTYEGRYYQLKDAPLSPKPVQAHLPVLVGGRGEKVMLGIVARYADEWNIGADPEAAAGVAAVLDEHCERIGRDPRSIHRTACTSVTISDDAAVVEKARAGRGWAVAGNVEEVRDAMGRYREAGFGEVILLNHYWGTDKQVRMERFARFIKEVAPRFKD